MRAFDYGNDRDDFQDINNFMYQDEDDDDDQEDDIDEIDWDDEEEMLRMAQMDLVASDLNQRLLESTIKLLEKSWFWRFKSIEIKLEMIESVYVQLSKLLASEGKA